MAKIKYGLSNVKYAKYNGLVDGTESYGEVKDLPGAVALTLDQSGDAVDEHADNVLWFHMDVNNGYTGTLELEVLPDSFRTDVLGEIKDANDVYYENSDADVKEFALLGQFNVAGDTAQTPETGKRFVFFRCTASRPSIAGSTKEANITPQHDTVNITAMSRVSDHLVKASAGSNSASYANWFNAVIVKP